MKLCLVFWLDMYFSDCFANNDQSNYPIVSESKKSFDYLHVSGFFFMEMGLLLFDLSVQKIRFLMPLKTVLLFYRDKLEKYLFQ